MPFDTATKRAGGISLRSAFGAMLVALVAALFIAAPAQGQAVPQSLEGEMFYADNFEGADNGAATVNPNCGGPVGGTFTISYTASGEATGPYPGMFTEMGTITGELLLGGFGRIETWNASFTIDSPEGQVEGEKTFIPVTPPVYIARCQPFLPTGNTAGAAAELAYRATIKTAAGTFADQGQAFANVLELNSDAGPFDQFSETFDLSTGVLPTTGKATGGGQVISGSNPQDRVTFGFNVRKTADGSRLQGNCNVLDHATDTHIKCLTVTDYVQTGNTATWEGTASVNGVQRPYRITVQDNGEPNRGADTFSIVAGTYQASGNVQNGNIKIHK
jgi:hypothetical protein